eukprot:1146487-Pelagomonas_calceolata.AAC.1
MAAANKPLGVDLQKGCGFAAPSPPAGGSFVWLKRIEKQALAFKLSWGKSACSWSAAVRAACPSVASITKSKDRHSS